MCIERVDFTTIHFLITEIRQLEFPRWRKLTFHVKPNEIFKLK